MLGLVVKSFHNVADVIVAVVVVGLVLDIVIVLALYDTVALVLFLGDVVVRVIDGGDVVVVVVVAADALLRHHRYFVANENFHSCQINDVILDNISSRCFFLSEKPIKNSISLFDS